MMLGLAYDPCFKCDKAQPCDRCELYMRRMGQVAPECGIKEITFEWLRKQLKKKRIARERAERKPNRSDAEIADINAAIEVLEYLLKKIIEKGGE